MKLIKIYSKITALLLLLFLTLPLWGISDADLLRQADNIASYMDADFSAEYTIIQEKPGQGRTKTVAGVFRRDTKETYVIVIMEPAINKGQGYLKQGKTLWFYDPGSRRFNSSSSQERFQNTNARNSDFTRSTLAQDYRISSGADAVLGSLKCRVLSLEASSTGMTYPKMKVWISEEGLVRKTEDYSLSGQLLRTSAITDYWFIGGRYVPKQILFVDALRGASINGTFINERTQITITKPSFRKLADSIFSKTFLESVNR
ncbi:outer membrane lipoprotein-sorting protein [Spirochaetia bacterium]|nr:outer membrane lipoprotein-sorting protein [Spirochaetia bacterium]